MKDNENGIAKTPLQGGTPMNKTEHYNPPIFEICDTGHLLFL